MNIVCIHGSKEMLEFVKLIYSIHPAKQISTHSWSGIWDHVVILVSRGILLEGKQGLESLHLLNNVEFRLLANLHNTRLSLLSGGDALKPLDDYGSRISPNRLKSYESFSIT